MEKVKKLQDILVGRLPNIKRWTRVEVYGPGDEMPEIIKDTQEVDDQTCFIYWNGRKSPTNHHSHEIRAFPLEDIDKLIIRNQERLRNERGVWR